MEDIDVQKLSRKELLQLCADHNIRTAGVKHDDLVRLLQNKLRPPASDPARATPKARSRISATNSPVSSPKARNQTSADSPFSSPNAKGKPAERPTPGSINQGRSLRPLVLVGDRSRNNLPEPSPTTPRKGQLSPNQGALPRRPTITRSNAPPAQRPDLLRKKVNTLTAIGKLQAQEKARPSNGRDASGPIGKSQQIDRGASARTRGSGTATPKNIKSAPAPAKRPGERARRNPKNESAKPSSPRASEGEASVAATVGTHSDLGSHSVGSVLEIATDAGRHSVWENSDADDAQSVSSEPASRFAPQNERFHSPSTLGHGRRIFSDSSDAPLAKDADPLQDDDDAAFNLIGDAHALEINSFLEAHEDDANTKPKALENSIPAPEPNVLIDIPIATSRSADEPENKTSHDSGEKDDPQCCSGKDSTAECIERVHFNLDSAPLPHPDMERSSKAVTRPQEARLGDGGELDMCAVKSTSESRSSKDESCTTKSNVLQQTSTDGSEKVPLLLESAETGTTLLVRRTMYPSSILSWCSQLFHAIFGTRSQH